jgi:hypothetical protein
VVVVVIDVVLVATEDVVATELTDVVAFGVVDLALLPHAATMVANANSTDPAVGRVTMVMQRMYVQATVTGQGRSSR